MKPRRKAAPSRRSPRKRLVISLPAWLVRVIDAEAQRIGIARRTLIEFWMAEQCEAWIRAQDRRR